MSTTTYNRILYWALAIVPMTGLGVIGRVYGPSWLLAFLLFYLLFYRPLLDMRRLLSLGVIEEKDAWRFLVPFAVVNLRYVKQLWLG